MSFTVKELVGRTRSQNADGSEETRQYILFGDNKTDTAADATTALLTEALASQGAVGLYADSVRITREVRNHPTLIMLGEANFATSAVSYPAAPAPVLDASEFSFNAQAPSGHIKYIYPGSTQTIYNDANNKDKPGESIGCEIVDGRKIWGTGVDLSPPPPTFILNYFPANRHVTGAFSKSLLDYVGTVNNSSFRLQGATFSAGELLLANCSGAKRTGDGWQISLGVSYEKNVNLTFANLNDGSSIAKKGHYYAWTLATSKNNAALDGIDAKPDFLAIAQVWEEKDWSSQIGSLGSGIQEIANRVLWLS